VTLSRQSLLHARLSQVSCMMCWRTGARVVQAVLPSECMASHSGACVHTGVSHPPHGNWFGVGGHWKLEEKLYFNQRGARVSAADYHAGSGMLVVAFTNGIFDLYELPGFQNVHTLSVTRERISSAAFNAAGNWVSPQCRRRLLLVSNERQRYGGLVPRCT
jgi:hypothetical protein